MGAYTDGANAVDHTIRAVMQALSFEERFRGCRVLVTGDTGFTGAWLALWLKRLGAEVFGAALPPETRPSLYEEAGIAGIVAHRDLDIRDAPATAALVRDVAPDFVFHLAAQALVRRGWASPLETYATNVLGTAHVLDACRNLPGLVAVVAVTTDKVYRNAEWAWGYRESDPLGGRDPYSASKAACELVVASYRNGYFAAQPGPPSLASARAGNIVGGGDWAADRIVPDIVRAIEAGAPLTLRNPRATRPWQHVLAACHGYLLAATAGGPGEAWNFGPEPAASRTVADVVAAFGAAWEAPEIRHEPSTIVEAGQLAVDAQRARTILGWRPAWDFAETMARTAHWYRDYAGGAAAADLCRRDIAAYREALAAAADGRGEPQ